MAFTTVLTVVGVDQPTRDLQLAIELCRKTDAHLSVLDVSIAAPPPIGDYAAVISRGLAGRAAPGCRANWPRMSPPSTSCWPTAACRRTSTSEYVEQALADDVIGRRARYADLTLVGPELSADRMLEPLVLKGVLFSAQRPVLVVPDGRQGQPAAEEGDDRLGFRPGGLPRGA